MLVSMSIKLGIIGFSEGNGHPFSWSAIFNGYDRHLMENCGFPVIPRYLEKEKWPDVQIQEAKVVCIWTQDVELSKKIAATCSISIVVENLEEMIKYLDGVLL